MARYPELDPGAFALGGGPVGCLLLHGFTGSPPEMRLLGEFLHDRGISVAAPLLPGHGTIPEDLNRTRWQDWASAAEEALLALRARCDVLFIAGLSMGTLLVIHLARRYPDVAGIVLYSPALKVAHRLLPLLSLLRPFVKQWPKESEEETDLTDPEAVKRCWSYESWPTRGLSELVKLQRVVRAELKEVRVPAMVFHSTLDTSIHPTSARRTFDGLGSQDKELVALHNSGHVVTVDSEREGIFARTYGFIAARCGGRLQPNVRP